MATTYLTRTLGTPTNNKKWTFSVWVKAGALSGDRGIMSIGGTTSSYTRTNFDGGGQLEFDNKPGGSFDGRRYGSAKRRDPAAWYHFVLVFDSDNVTGDDRMITYVNGSRITAYDNDLDPSSGAASGNTSSQTIRIGITDSAAYWNGVMAHAHFCDGQAYAASDFGETDSTSGIWIAKSSPSVTYGDNGGFYKFASGALGTDSSGEGNTMTVSGTMTNTKDTPDNNFPTGNYLDYDSPASNFTWTNGNNTILDNADAAWRTATATQGMASGKWYFEAKLDAVGSYGGIGVIDSNQTSPGSYEFGGQTRGYGYYNSGQKHNSGSDLSYGDTYTTGDIISVALDLTNLKIYFAKNGTWQNSGVPTSGATGTGAAYTVSSGDFYLPCVGVYANTKWSYNFGNGYFGTTIVSSSESDDAGLGSFEYDVPAGYYTLCTTNLGDQS